MTEKETLIARLKELGVKLDREVNVTGTIQELTLRISELEEELDEDGEEGAEAASSAVISTSGQPGADIASGSITENESVSIVEPGVIIRVTEQDAVDLIEKGLAREV